MFLDSIENSLLTGSNSVLGSDIILQLLLFQVHDEERLEHRVHKIEDNLCSKEPYLAQLFGTDSLSKDQENQIRYVFFVYLAKPSCNKSVYLYQFRGQCYIRKAKTEFIVI